MVGVIATTPKDSGRGDSSRAKPGDFRKHLNFCEFVKHEENVGRRREKSVKNPEKKLKFLQITVLFKKFVFTGVFPGSENTSGRVIPMDIEQGLVS